MDMRAPAGQQLSNHTKQLLRLLLVPSWFSASVSILLSMGATFGILFASRYEGSELQQQFLNWQATSTEDTLGTAAGSLQQNTADLVSIIVLFIFWYAVGTVIYLLAVAIYNTIRSANEAHQHLYYINTSRSAFLRALYVELALRFASLTAWVWYAVISLKIVIPYLLGAVHIADVHYPSIGAVCLLAVATLGLLVATHLHVIFLRLFLGKPRVFHGDTYLIGLSSGH